MTKALDILHQKRAPLMELARKYGVLNVRVFGSVARGDDRPDSDIDLLVALEKNRDYFDLGGFQMDATDLLKRYVDVVLDTAVHHLIRVSVFEEARPI